MSQSNENFILLSINHETVPIDIRERYSVDESRLSELYQKLKAAELAQESLILNTCNRFELYTRTSDVTTPHDVVAALSHFYGYAEDELREHLKIRSGQDAIQHLIEVSAGLRSQITGEAEIFGQVKAAYAKAQEEGQAGKVINRVFQKGFQAAKLIRNSTRVGQGQINIANVAVELSSKIFGSLKDASALAIGTGDIGQKTVKALVSRGVKNVGVVSRSMERAESFAEEWNAKPHTLDGLEDYLASYDIVIASSGQEQPIITARLARDCGVSKRDLPLFLIDLGLPRNIERSCEELDNVFLYNLDDLAAIAEENLADRRKAVRESEAIASQKSQAIWDTLKRRGEV